MRGIFFWIPSVKRNSSIKDHFQFPRQFSTCLYPWVLWPRERHIGIQYCYRLAASDKAIGSTHSLHQSDLEEILTPVKVFKSNYCLSGRTGSYHCDISDVQTRKHNFKSNCDFQLRTKESIVEFEPSVFNEIVANGTQGLESLIVTEEKLSIDSEFTSIYDSFPKNIRKEVLKLYSTSLIITEEKPSFESEISLESADGSENTAYKMAMGDGNKMAADVLPRPYSDRRMRLDNNSMICMKALMGLVLVMCSNVAVASNVTLPKPCNSNIYCYGDLLKTVQLAHINKDSKYFVDMTLKDSPEVINENFDTLMHATNNKPTKEQVTAFVEDNFNEPGTEFETWLPGDWQENPSFLNNISDPKYREWAADLHAIWKDLGRKISSNVRDQPDRYSQLYVDNPVVVPGGRFREFYYWDSYWTIDGLLLSGMTDTVKGMLENFIQMVQQYGMVPNGGRVYYTRRSQPPYMIPMIKLYVDHTKDLDFVRDNIGQMEKEFNFWVNNRTREVIYNGKSYNVAQYISKVDDPRPESYREDLEVAQSVPEDERTQLYVEYKSGAESGWDYSSRWFVDGETNKGGLKNLAVTSIAPVDLNSLLCYNAKIIADYYHELGNHDKANLYQAVYAEKKELLAELFWDETDGVWYDVNIVTMTKRKFFYLSNIHPLWTRSFDEKNTKAIVEKVVSYLQKKKVLDYIGGVPTSSLNTGQQWDYPNAWAPLQHLVVMALRQHRDSHPEVDEISLQLAEKWIKSAWQGYEDVQAMFEKYNVEIIGAPGGGGEYDVQLGFGWTNGVALRFLNDFGDRLVSPDSTTGETTAITDTTSAGVKMGSASYLIPMVAAASYCIGRQ